MTTQKYNRGDIYWTKLECSDGSCVIQGIRPVLIISSDISNLNSTLVNVIPITSQLKKTLPIHVSLKGYGLKKDSIAIVEQVLTIDKKRLIKYIGNVDQIKMKEFSSAITKQFSLSA